MNDLRLTLLNDKGYFLRAEHHPSQPDVTKTPT
jgi:hypothetical protein